MPAVDLHAHSCYSFLDGASQPEELAHRAAALGYDALALTDHDSLCGSLEFAIAARDAGLRPITGCELTLRDGSHLTLLVEDARGYRNLCRLITLAHADDRRAPAIGLDQVERHAEGLHCRGRSPGWSARAAWPMPSERRCGCGGSSAASASRSSCSAPTGAGTPAATGCWKSWRPACVCPPWRPATRTPTPLAGPTCRTRWWPSA
jgi:hypothetical protein